MPENFKKARTNNEMPTFVIKFWDVSKKKLKQGGHNVNAEGLCKRFAKHFFEGDIKHMQSGDYDFFHSVSEFHAFIEKHRYN